MFQTKRFGLVASKQEYQMLCRAERHMNKIQKKKPTGQRLPAKFILKKIWFSIVYYILIRYNNGCRWDKESRPYQYATAFRKWFPESGKGMILMETKESRKVRKPCYRTGNLSFVSRSYQFCDSLRDNKKS